MNRKHLLKRCSLLLVMVLFLSALLSGCKWKEEQTKNEPVSKTTFLLNTVISITLYDSEDEAIIDEAFSLIKSYENIYSRTLETSELYQLNHRLLKETNQGYAVSDKLASLLDKAYYYSNLSNGALDLTIEPVSSLWDFQSDTPVVPDANVIKEQIAHVGYQNLTLQENFVQFGKDNMGIDLGSIAKGYIADRVKEFLKQKGVTSAMINLGGNVLCVGSKPDGTPFNVGIQKPFADRSETCAIMQLSDMSVVSSGIYERCFKKDGKLYHHILDPSTGYPVDNHLIAVTIISKESVAGDGLSTAVFSLGLEKGMELIDSIDDVYAVFITDDYTLHYSKGFKENITVEEQN